MEEVINMYDKYEQIATKVKFLSLTVVPIGVVFNLILSILQNNKVGTLKKLIFTFLALSKNPFLITRIVVNLIIMFLSILGQVIVVAKADQVKHNFLVLLVFVICFLIIIVINSFGFSTTSGQSPFEFCLYSTIIIVLLIWAIIFAIVSTLANILFLYLNSHNN